MVADVLILSALRSGRSRSWPTWCHLIWTVQIYSTSPDRMALDIITSCHHPDPWITFPNRSHLMTLLIRYRPLPTRPCMSTSPIIHCQPISINNKLYSSTNQLKSPCLLSLHTTTTTWVNAPVQNVSSPEWDPLLGLPPPSYLTTTTTSPCATTTNVPPSRPLGPPNPLNIGN